METGHQIAKARHWWAFLRLSEAISPGAGLAGWRRSADRTRLQANSLLSGNLTGNFAILGLQVQISEQETAALQRIFVEFPTQSNRENISRNREISYGNREFWSLECNNVKKQRATPRNGHSSTAPAGRKRATTSRAHKAASRRRLRSPQVSLAPSGR